MSYNKNKSKNNSTELPVKPTPPEPYECCERGCDPCVHDYYAKSLARWEKRVAEIQKHQQKVMIKKALRK
ncbi:MAG: oxidoreductase-like domain-containing protein [Gammaproteobacteria bacterium]|nr:oxidoreductase-like domain-containing protein [Gammaproteobacteria bacterium]